MHPAEVGIFASECAGNRLSPGRATMSRSVGDPNRKYDGLYHRRERRPGFPPVIHNPCRQVVPVARIRRRTANRMAYPDFACTVLRAVGTYVQLSAYTGDNPVPPALMMTSIKCAARTVTPRARKLSQRAEIPLHIRLRVILTRIKLRLCFCTIYRLFREIFISMTYLNNQRLSSQQFFIWFLFMQLLNCQNFRLFKLRQKLYFLTVLILINHFLVKNYFLFPRF